MLYKTWLSINKDAVLSFIENLKRLSIIMYFKNNTFIKKSVYKNFKLNFFPMIKR